MTKTKRSLKVFLCHAHSDKDTVKALYDRLTNDGVNAWLDKENLLPGQDWELEIRKAVYEADVVVVCLSKQFNQAGFRQKEVRIALDTAMEQLEGDIFIIPSRLEECDVPEKLQRYHWVDFFDDNGYEKLMQSIRLRDNQLEKARIEKEEAIKRRLPTFDSPLMTQQSITQHRSENLPLEDIPVKPDPYKSDKSSSDKKLKAKRPIKTEYVIAIIGAVATIVAGILSSPLLEKWLSSIPVVSATATLLPTEITDSKGVQMVLVPASEFIMGGNAEDAVAMCEKYSNTDCQKSRFENEEPIHTVNLDSFYIDKYEVTNTNWKNCVNAKVCNLPVQTDSVTRTNYYIDPEYDDFPVINVTWHMAQDFCEWRDASLPTEAQWEKAARGIDGFIYPWGNNINCSYANYFSGSNGCVGDTTKVGSYKSGKSVYGVYDMAGNVAEWTLDWYSETYYQDSPASDPQGPNSGEYRVYRGGAWYFVDFITRSTYRGNDKPEQYIFYLGFRCATDAP